MHEEPQDEAQVKAGRQIKHGCHPSAKKPNLPEQLGGQRFVPLSIKASPL
jgi:hypothetical protein